jgi:hypothetical protein
MAGALSFDCTDRCVCPYENIAESGIRYEAEKGATYTEIGRCKYSLYALYNKR